MSIGIIILAAGSSSRMGQSKQLLQVNQHTLLSLATKTAVQSGADHVLVVLGANNHAHLDTIRSLNVETIINKEWKKGMGNSLKTGIRHLTAHYRDIDAILVMVCDQPKVTPLHLKELISMYKTEDKAIVASYYGQMPGVPVVFGRKYFDLLLSLDDQEGAKKVILKNPADASIIHFPDGAVDLDTLDDYRRFQRDNS